MLSETYEYIWENIIEPNIIKIYTDADKSAYNILKMKEISEVKRQLLEGYNIKKDRLKMLYHFDDIEGNEEDKKIDCHKIAACFASVIYENKIFTYDITKQVTDKIYLANSRLAYNISLGIVKMNLVFGYLFNSDKNNNYEEFAEEVLNRNKLIVPSTNPGHDSYNLGRVKTLALNDIFGNEFDVLAYSDMMFWIENYNRQIIENKVKPEPFKLKNELLQDIIKRKIKD